MVLALTAVDGGRRSGCYMLTNTSATLLLHRYNSRGGHKGDFVKNSLWGCAIFEGFAICDRFAISERIVSFDHLAISEHFAVSERLAVSEPLVVSERLAISERPASSV